MLGGSLSVWFGLFMAKTPIGLAIVAMAAAIVTIANIVMAAVVEPQQSWS